MGKLRAYPNEVATMAADRLELILDGWMWESPAELIPTRDQIREVRKVLAARLDRGDPGDTENPRSVR